MHKRCGGVSMIGGYEHLRWLNEDVNVETVFDNSKFNFLEIYLDVSQSRINIVSMKVKKKIAVRDWESVKVSKIIAERVRQHKEDTGVAIGRFFELAAEEKLKRDTK